jgi:hypothetical protein
MYYHKEKDIKTQIQNESNSAFSNQEKYVIIVKDKLKFKFQHVTNYRILSL